MNEELKVLIVDDEWMIRDGLKTFPWEKFGCRVAGEAEDGDEGMMLAKVLLPDIILTDIKMPGIDGLELARQVKELRPDTEIILLTGYDNFDFAQTAIRTGVSDYLLKPTNFHEMERLVEKLCARIRQRSLRRSHYQELKQKYERALPILISNLTGDLLRGKPQGREDLRKRLRALDIRIEKYIVLCAHLDYDDKFLEEANIEEWLLEFGITNISEEILSRHCGRVFTETDVPAYRFILAYDGTSPDAGCLHLCYQACLKIQKAVREYIGRPICFGISSVGTDVSQMSRYARQAGDACRQRSFFDAECIMLYRDIDKLQKNSWYIRNGEKHTILGAVSAGNLETIQRCLRSIRDEILEQAPDIDSVKSGMLELTIDAVRAAEDVNAFDVTAHLSTLHSSIEAIYSCDTVDKLIACVWESLSRLAQKSSSTSVDYHQQTVDRILAYIAEHYQEDISLNLLSDNFQLSSAYISRLIKKHTSHSFIEILSDVRMEKARELLAAGGYKIQQVAELTGYHDLSYFIQVFRKKYGVTPKEYKNLT